MFVAEGEPGDKAMYSVYVHVHCIYMYVYIVHYYVVCNAMSLFRRLD